MEGVMHSTHFFFKSDTSGATGVIDAMYHPQIATEAEDTEGLQTALMMIRAVSGDETMRPMTEDEMKAEVKNRAEQETANMPTIDMEEAEYDA